MTMIESEAADLRQKFLDAMSHTACTVNVVTTDGSAGRAGVTVSAMSSVSADTPKPSLLVCVHHLSPAAEKIVANGVFCVNVLQDHQSHIADIFAGRHKTSDGDKFSCAEWTTERTGAPRVRDPLVAFDCAVVSGEKVGTHHVFIGEVQHIFSAERGSALIFANRAYGSPTRMLPVARSFGDGLKDRQRLAVGCFHSFGPFVLPALFSRMVRLGAAIEVRIVEGDHRTVVSSLMSGESEIALLYDIDLPGELECDPLTSLSPYVLLAEGHPLAKKAELRIEDLVDEPFVLLDGPPSRDYFLSIFAKADVQPNVAFATSSLELVRGIVGHGLGYSILATKPAAAMTYDGRALVTRPLIADAHASLVVLAKRKGAKLSQPAFAFAENCREHFAPEH